MIPNSRLPGIPDFAHQFTRDMTTYKRVLVLYPHPCTDGMASYALLHHAMSIYDRDVPIFGFEYQPITYGEIDKLTRSQVCDTLVLCLDYSVTVEELGYLRALGARKVYVLDHHDTADRMYADLATHDIKKLPVDSYLNVYMDQSCSGAMLTAQFCDALYDMGFACSSSNLGTDKYVGSKLVEYVQDYDLWRWELPNSAEINAYIQSLPQGNDYYVRWCQASAMLAARRDTVIVTGKRILAYERKIVEDIVNSYVGVLRIDYNGQLIRMPIVQCPHSLRNKVCELLMERAASMMCAATTKLSNGNWKVSLRGSDPSPVNLAKVAESLRGGGHITAAGFTTSQDPFNVILNR